jgi:peptidoglycan/LPS O-acetylase OafA/YrhL
MTTTRRNDIQGLRAIAVLLVVFYHSNLIFDGGFIGVDVFFVISGYVIMKSLLAEYNSTSTISVRNFMTRRVRRLLPASSVVVVFTLIASLFVFSPFFEHRQIGLSSLSSTFFSANLYFILQNSYSALINNPFRHMWSLGVEEQFYIYLICSIAFLLRDKSNRGSFQKKMLVFLIATSITSFVFNLIFSSGIRLLPLPTRIAFFSPLTRIWELQLGVLIAFIPIHSIRFRSLKYSGDLLAGLGLVLIFWSGFTFNSFMQFPGVIALIPTTGALLLILASPNSRVIGNLLSIKPLRIIGDLSYSWYLWHWPLIVFSEALFPGSRVAVLTAGFGSVIPAYISYHFVENRFRSSDSNSSVSPLKIASISLSIQFLCAMALIIGATSTYGLKQPVAEGANGSWAFAAGCQMTELPFPADRCSHSVEQPQGTVLLIGDSQAGSISDGVFSATELLNLNFVVWYNDGCPIFPRPTVERSDCPDFQKSIPELISFINPDLIVVANKASLYGMGGVQHGGLSIKNADGSTPDTYSETIQMWTDGIQEIFSSASFINSKILYVQQVPTSKPTSPTLIRKTSSNSTFDLSFSSNRNEIVQAEEQALSGFNDVTLFNPADYLCPNNRCSASKDENSIYSDEYHLSPYGAQMLAPSIGQVIKQLLNI